MAMERKWNSVPPQVFASSGNPFGLVTLADTAGFKVKQIAYLKSNTAPSPLAVQVKRVLSPTMLIVGLPDNKIASWQPLDISAYTVASVASIGAEEQNKNNIPEADHYSSIYESDPTVADRVVQVDKYGNFYDKDNPIPIIFDGTINVGEVEIVGKDGYTLEPNVDGSINVVQVTPVLNPFIVNIPVPLANTEQFFTFPSNTHRFMLKIRDGASKMRIAWVAGDTSTNYISASAGAYYAEEINVSGQTLYFQLGKASQIIELLYWVQP